MEITTKKRSPYLRWLHYVKRYSFYVALAYGAVVLVMAIEVVMPKAVGFVIDGMLKGGAARGGPIHLPLLGDMGKVKAFGIMLLVLSGLILIRAFMTYWRAMLLNIVGEKVHIDLRTDLFEHLQRLPIAYFDKSYTGRIMARLTTDTDALWHLLHDGTLNVVAPSLTIVVILVVLFKIHVFLTLVTLCVLPVMLMMYWRTRKRTRSASRLRQEKLADIYTRLQEQITGIRIVRFFGRGADESEEFTQDLHDLYTSNIDMLRLSARLGVRNDFITGVTVAAILCLGGIAVAAGQLTVGELVQFYIYAGMLFAPLRQMTNASASVFSTADVALERIFELLDQPPAQEVRPGGRQCPPLKGRISIRDLSFFYDPGRQVFDGLSCEIEAGETVALVGPSGGGKSTLVNLICRFYYPQQGLIAADGLDLTTLDVESYRRQISYVAQENFLFTGTIAENIGYANPEADLAQIRHAAKLANAHEFISRLPQGYDTEMGERGVLLSGGQKQRLNIARALLRNPRILILDEPTSALDAESESTLLEALKTVFKGKTCIIIAHRLSTVASADRTIVLDNGKIVQQGRHSDLMRGDGLYRELCKKQLLAFGGSEPKVPEFDRIAE